jgi:hypothetical protein
MRCARFLGVLGFGAIVCIAHDGGRTENHLKSLDDALQVLKSNAIVAAAGVGVPEGRFVLIRGVGGVTCAVRFTSLLRGRDAKPPTVFSSGAESLSAQADVYRRDDSARDFSSASFQHEHLALSSHALIGIGRLAFERGTVAIKCGRDRLLWGFPTWLAFPDRGHTFPGRGPVEMAPTAWTEVSQVKVSDPQLKWLKYDDSRTMSEIPLGELPGGDAGFPD